MESKVRGALSRLGELCSPDLEVDPAFLGWGGADPGGEPSDVPAAWRPEVPPSPGSPDGPEELAFLPLHQAAGLVAGRLVSPVALCEAVLERIERLDPLLDAFITVTAELARRSARAAADEIARGNHRGPLHGIPVSLKDVIATAGVLTTCGARLLEAHVPTTSATAWSRLEAAGAVLVGKNNLLEFASGGSVGNERFGCTRNPWDPDRLANGSSGGSAAAVAAGMSYGSVATETGASIQRPASFCGVVGMKPTYGRISRAGVTPTAWSTDHVGVLTRSVADVAVLVSTMAGTDDLDPTTSRAGRPGLLPERATPGLHGLTIGIPWRHIDGQVDEEVAEGFRRTIDSCERSGVRMRPVDAPELDYAGTTSVAIQLVEATTYHARRASARPKGYSSAFRRRLELGADISAHDYLQAQRARRAIGRAVDELLEEVDLLWWPTTPTAATPVEAGASMLRDRPWKVGASHYNLMRLCSLVGIPAVSQPTATTRDGLPLSVQLAGRRWEEGFLLSAAMGVETVIGWSGRPPASTATTGDGAPAGGGG